MPGEKEEMILEELEKPLSASAVKKRKQGNFELSYIEGHHAIREANRIFGFMAWERATLDMNMVQCQEITTTYNNQDKTLWYVSYTCRARVTVMEVSRDGYGFGQGQDKDLGRAHESAIKEAETDAMKRALMTFGDPFGLALYDKDQTHVEKASKSKEPVQAKPRNGKADPSAPFGWQMQDIAEGDWRYGNVTNPQMKYWQELCAQHGIPAEEMLPFRSILIRAYGLDPEMLSKSGGYSFGIEFLKDASDDAILACMDATKAALAAKANGKTDTQKLGEAVREVFEGATK